MFQPTLPPYDVAEWKQQPFATRLKWVCQAWALQGYGAPLGIYIFYGLKVALYVWGWAFFCSFTPGMGEFSRISTWAFTAIAFQKAVLWSMAYEGLGLGCGSGPLTGRYVPPISGFIHFAWPGTTKMPFFPGVPVFGGQRRSLLDALLYLLHYGLLLRALMAPQLSFSLLWPIALSLLLLGLTDKTLFLASRAEHYWTALICFLFASHWLVGAKLVWVSIWMWAATSKLNRHFPSVVCVMLSNSPFTQWGPFRKWLYRQYPDDLRPSKLAEWMAHCGTFVEFCFPIALLLSSGGTPTFVALCAMLGFHIFITGNVPMGVPIEWNVLMVYGAFFLFGHHASVGVFVWSSPWMLGFLAFMVVLVPLWGNFVPAQVSFLCSMRYYAGNWPYSVWLFRGECSKKLDEHIKKISPRVQDQLSTFYDEEVITSAISRVMAFRAMHLQGRALQLLLPKAVDDIDAYEYLDGELVAGLVLGWNFGDGHLHQLQLLEAVQAQCQFEPGELRCLFVESQPMAGESMGWSIVDAADGVLERGEIAIAQMLDLHPWPLEEPDSPN